MEVVYPCCGGLDVHKKRITACVLWAEAQGKSRQTQRDIGAHGATRVGWGTPSCAAWA